MYMQINKARHHNLAKGIDQSVSLSQNIRINIL